MRASKSRDSRDSKSTTWKEIEMNKPDKKECNIFLTQINLFSTHYHDVINLIHSDESHEMNQIKERKHNEQIWSNVFFFTFLFLVMFKF